VAKLLLFFSNLLLRFIVAFSQIPLTMKKCSKIEKEMTGHWGVSGRKKDAQRLA